MLGGMSLVVTVLLVGTLLTITVNERLGEIATLRAIGVGRATIVHQVLAEGTALTIVGAARASCWAWSPRSTSTRSSPASPDSRRVLLLRAPRGHAGVCALVLLVTGSLAGLYPAWLASGRRSPPRCAPRRHEPRRSWSPATAQGLPHERGDGARPSRRLSRVQPGEYVGHRRTVRQREVHPAPALGGIDMPAAGVVGVLGTRLESLATAS